MRRGFTLLELIITLAVVAILATIALPSFFGETRKNKSSAEVQPMFSDIRTRLEEYLQEHGSYPPGPGESTWNPTSSPGTTRATLDLAAPLWQPLHVRPSAELEVYCRYTWESMLASAISVANASGDMTARSFTTAHLPDRQGPRAPSTARPRHWRRPWSAVRRRAR